MVAFSDTTPSHGITFDSSTRTFTFDRSAIAGNTRTIKIKASPSTSTTSDTVLISSFVVTYIDVILDPSNLSAIRTISY